MALAADVDAGLIGMHELRAGEPTLHPLFERCQPLKGLLVEVEHRTRADGDLHLIGEVISDPIIRDQLVLRHIHGIGLKARTILDRSLYPCRESGYKAIALIIFQDLCPVLGHEP